jgi:hypothetical protein
MVGPEGKITLIWDSFTAHKDVRIIEVANSLNIDIILIPSGMTDTYQPLDRRIFGNLKMRAKGRWTQMFETPANLRRSPRRCPENANDIDVPLALEIMVESWLSIPQDQVLKAWAHLSEL